MVRTTLLALAAATALSLTLPLASATAKESTLYSRRLQKRFIDSAGHYNISFYHINDVHAHLDQFASSGTDCVSPTKGCYGGYARVKTVLEETRPGHKDSLLLNAGDEFQGTLFYTYYGGEKIGETLNQLGFDAMTLGNHEFDRGDAPLGEFLKNLTFPIVGANVHSEDENVKEAVKPYHVFEEYGLAVIGATTTTVPNISSPDKNTTFSDVVQAVQAAIDEIKATTNITRIAALTHIGYEEDKKLAQATTGLHLIIGGHSHTPLGDFAGAEGPYPTLETNAEGEEVFIVTAYRWGEYLGYIDVTYDEEGRVLAYHGAPIHLTNTTSQDKGLQSQIDAWRVPFEEFAGEVVGSSKVVLDQSTCQRMECTLGDLIAEAILQYRLASSSSASFALVNAGGVRATIDAGNITRGAVLTSFPFSNAVVEVSFRGSELWSIIEGILSKTNQANNQPVTSFLQVSSGVRILYNPSNAAGEKLISLEIGGEKVSKGGETWEKKYTVVTIDFVAGGGDNFFAPVSNLVVLDTLDEVLVRYLQDNSPIDFKLDGRIAVVNGSRSRTTGDLRRRVLDASSSPLRRASPNSAASAGVVSGIVLLVWTALLAAVVL
ncbi:Metallo-dependent phosphatase-like protein [Astrocystis sublimbata]|nr:Metallo-dependent phosphatase-like protein [Astrocystis sublimbata]